MLVNNEDKAPFHMTRAGLSFATRAAAWACRAVAPSALENAVLPQTSDRFRAMKELSEYLGFFVALVSRRLSCPRCDSSWADGSSEGQDALATAGETPALQRSNPMKASHLRRLPLSWSFPPVQIPS
jgi:hypothetical protein